MVCVPEGVDGVRRWISRLRRSEGVWGHAQQQVGSVVLWQCDDRVRVTILAALYAGQVLALFLRSGTCAGLLGGAMAPRG
jgi:phage gp46-like protein|eukprot:SAG25_NODE_3081_length_1226_cov_2.527063_1_plen_80_part_00